MTRPAVDVVVPFAGEADELERVAARLRSLRLRDGDTLVIVDNSPRPRPVPPEGPLVVHDGGLPTPAYARNRGAEAGSAEWILFIDADVVPPPDLLDRYFDPAPAERTALVGGGVIDEAVPKDAPAAARYASIRGLMSQDNTFGFGDWSFPTTTNLACRRAAFEAVGRFRDDIRAAEDADLTYRLKAAGWQVERREGAAVVHLGRQTVRGFIAQKLVHGAGGAWLDREYPGAFPARRRPGLAWWGIRTAVKGLVSAARSRDRDKALWALLEPLELLSFEFGRSLRNQRSRSRRPPP